MNEQFVTLEGGWTGLVDERDLKRQARSYGPLRSHPRVVWRLSTAGGEPITGKCDTLDLSIGLPQLYLDERLHDRASLIAP